MSISARRRAAAIVPALACAAVITCSDGPTGPSGPDRTPVSLVASHDSLVLAAGDSAMAWFEARDAQGTLVVPPGVTWSSLDPGIATVTNGKVRAIAAGTGRVTITLGALADTIRIRALIPIDATDLEVASAQLEAIGARTTLQATSSAAGELREGRYEFVLRNPAAAVFEEAHPWGAAILRALGPGDVWVVVQEHGGTADSVLVRVRPALATFAFTEHLVGFRDRTISPTITGTDINGNQQTTTNFVLHVTDSSIALPTGSGTLQLLKEGFTRVEAVTAVGGRAYAELDVRAYPRIDAGLITQGSQAPVARMGVGQVASGTVSTIDGPLHEQTFTVTVTGDPAVSAQLSGTQLTYTALQPGDARVIIASPLMVPDTVGIHVTPSHVHIDSGIALIGVGTTRATLMRIGDAAGQWRERLEDVTVTLTSSDSTILRVDPSSRTLSFDRQSNAAQPVQFTGVAPGTARLTASAPGLVSWEFDYTVTTNKHLLLTPHSTTMGADQTTAPPLRMGTPWRVRASDRSADVLVTFTHSNPAVATTSGPVTLNTFDLFEEVQVEARAPGVDTIVATATGFVPDTVVLTVTSPRFVPTGQAPILHHFLGGITVGVGDTLGFQHTARADVVVYGESSDSAVVVPGVTTLPAGWLIPMGLPLTLRDTGVATITVRDSAGVIPPMIVPVRVVPSPALSVIPFGDTTDLVGIGAGQRFGAPFAITIAPFDGAPSDMDVEVVSTNMSVLPLSMVVPMRKGVFFEQIQLPVPTAVGSARVVVKAKGFVPDTSMAITVGVPELEFVRFPATIRVGQQDIVRVRLTDQRGRGRVTDAPITLALSMPGGGFETVQTTIPAAGSLTADIPVTFTQTGTFRLVASHVSGGPVAYAPDTVVVHVRPVVRTVAFAPSSVTLGVGQRVDVNTSRTGFIEGEVVDFTVAALQGRATVPASVTFGGTSTGQPITVVATRLGVDTLTIAATDYVGDSVRVVVTEGRLRLTGLPASGPAGTSYTVTLSTLDSTGIARAVHEATQFAIGASDGVSITAPDGTPLTSITVPAGSSTSGPFVVRSAASGPRSVVVSRAGYVQLQALFTASP